MSGSTATAEAASAVQATNGRTIADAATVIGFSDRESRILVANETRSRLEIRAADSALILAPLETRYLPKATVETLPLEPLKLLGFVRTEDSPQTEVGPRERALYLAGAFYGGLAFLLWGIFVGTGWLYWTLLGLVVAAAAVSRLSQAKIGIGVRAVQAFYLLIVLLVGVGMPVAAVWAGGDIDDVWSTAVNGSGNDQEIATLTLLGRGIQTVFIVVVTLLPGLLYFLFDRYRLSTLGEEFTRQIFRLDRQLRTRGDIDAKYGHLLGEAYGHQHRRGGRSARIQPGTRLPIVVATVVFALGWIVVLLNAEVEVEVIATDGLRSLITPWQSATAFAFLGAYVFLLQAALRAYLRGDLRPKFYGYAALRVVVAVVFSWVLDLMISTDGPELLVTAFAIGLVPDTFLLRLREFVRASTLDVLVEKHPLTELEGIDVYDRTRLEQEGVTNVEALAHSNLVELMLQTRIPVGRLVDWADQAQLQLHLDPEKGEEQLAKLRCRGIRTASDLLVTYRMAKGRSDADARKLLGALGSIDGLPVLRTVIDALKDDEWMPQILDWHDAKNRAERTLVYPDHFATAIPVP